MAEASALFTTKIKSGRNTYYVDVKEAKNGNKYLSITENQYDGETNKKTTIRVFGDAIGQLSQAITEAVASIDGI